MSFVCSSSRDRERELSEVFDFPRDLESEGAASCSRPMPLTNTAPIQSNASSIFSRVYFSWPRCASRSRICSFPSFSAMVSFLLRHHATA